MGFDDDSFDVAYMEDVLEHVRNPAAVLNETCRVLRPGGSLVARFPTIKGLLSHHLGRALYLPGAHYLVPFHRWAAGLNHHLIYRSQMPEFEPFSRTVSTPFHPAITENLNGMTYADFRRIASDGPFEIDSLELLPWRPRGSSGVRARLHSLLWQIRELREILSLSVVFVGRKPRA